MTQRYSVETKIEIWNDDTGEKIEVGPDRDGGDMIEIRNVDKAGNVGDRLAYDVTQARLVAEAIISLTENANRKFEVEVRPLPEDTT
jgi:hypothetical protein